MLTTLRALLVAVLLLVATPAQGGVGVIPGTGAFCGMGATSHTLLLVNAEPFPFVDSSSYARVVTNVTTTQSAAQVKFGGQSIRFDAASDYLSVPDAVEWTLSGAFCISIWSYAAIPVANRYVSAKYTGALDRSWRTIIGATGSVAFSAYDAADTGTIAIVSAAGVFPDSVWTHIEACRTAAMVTNLYINGVNAGNDAVSNALQNSAAAVALGYTASASSLVGYHDAHIITSGGWAWNRNHTPPNRRW